MVHRGEKNVGNRTGRRAWGRQENEIKIGREPGWGGVGWGCGVRWRYYVITLHLNGLRAWLAFNIECVYLAVISDNYAFPSFKCQCVWIWGTCRQVCLLPWLHGFIRHLAALYIWNFTTITINKNFQFEFELNFVLRNTIKKYNTYMEVYFITFVKQHKSCLVGGSKKGRNPYYWPT